MLTFRFAPLVGIALTAAIALVPGPSVDAAPAAASKPEARKAEAVVEAAPTKSVPIRRATASPRTAVTKAAPVPAATPAPKKPGFWERVFGKKKAAPTPVPATPTPKPAYKKKAITKARKPKPKITTSRPDETAPTPGRTDAANVEPGTNEEGKTPPAMTEENPKPPIARKPKPKKGDKSQNFPPTTDNPDAEIVEKQKYDQAKAKAVADPKIQELRGKADLAANEEESRKALRAYNKAMFKRMKEVEPSIKDHIDDMEAEVLKRIGE